MQRVETQLYARVYDFMSVNIVSTDLSIVHTVSRYLSIAIIAHYHIILYICDRACENQHLRSNYTKLYFR